MLGLHFYNLSPLEKLFCHQILKMTRAVNATLFLLLLQKKKKCPSFKLSPHKKVKKNNNNDKGFWTSWSPAVLYEPCHPESNEYVKSFRVSYFLYDKLKSHHETHVTPRCKTQAKQHALCFSVVVVCILKCIYMTKDIQRLTQVRFKMYSLTLGMKCCHAPYSLRAKRCFHTAHYSI